MNEEKIFGPLTFKQTLYSLAGAGLSYILYTYTEPKIYIPAIIIIAGIIITLVRNSPVEVIDEHYIQVKKATTSVEDFNKWIAYKSAMIASQIEMMKQRDLREDIHLVKLKELLERFRNK